MLQSHTPPIAASPARLGLTSSPSLPPNPNPNPKPLPPSSSSSSSAPPRHPHSPPTSAALLYLLPPLPRAQSLLLQLASLATNLFEISPHRTQWLAAFRGSLPPFLPTAQRLPHPPSSPKETLALFTSLQTQLFDSVSELQEILDLKDSRLKLVREVRSKDATLLAFARKLKDAEQALDRLVDDYSDYRRDPKRSKHSQDQELEEQLSEYSSSLHSSLDLEEILAYAHRISYTTFAPPEHGAGLAPLRGALPPAPQDNEMRASQLYHFADLDVGVPKKAPEAKKREADTGLPPPLMEPTPPREELPPPPLLPIAVRPGWVPPGWIKGMPVELPIELPPVPPGWKPGDPVPLPVFDGVLAGNKGEEQRIGGVPVLPNLPPPQLKPGGPIQVGYVELDINPGHDDDTSDYSSDVGSSDEDDEE